MVGRVLRGKARTSRGLGRVRGLAVVVAVALVAAGCGSEGDDAAAGPRPTRTTPSAVGVRTETFTRVDAAGQPRALLTQIYYPAQGEPGPAVPDAPKERAGSPFPLIVFSHGLGSAPGYYGPLLEAWASAGFVVAAPTFPGTSRAVTANVDPGDYVEQPADVSAVITEMFALSEDPDDVFFRFIRPSGAGVAGHSLGGITTLGVATNTCCRDGRISAAVVLAGDPLAFPDGEFDYRGSPPLLLVHGTEDELVTYDGSIDVFNAGKSPKALLTLEGGDHSAAAAVGDDAEVVIATTTAFFDAYLKDDSTSLQAIEGLGSSDSTRVVLVAEAGAQVTVPTRPRAPDRELRATVTPDSGLRGGQEVLVEWSGFTPGGTVNVVQCSNRVAGDASACDLQKGKILQPNPSGDGSVALEIVVGPVGTGVCDASTDDCQIVVNDGGSLDPADSVRIPISFAPT